MVQADSASFAPEQLSVAPKNIYSCHARWLTLDIVRAVGSQQTSLVRVCGPDLAHMDIVAGPD